MPILHMETELVSDTAAQLQQVAGRIEGQTQELNSAVYRLQSVWEGSSQYDFTADVLRLVQSLNNSADTATILGQRLQSEVNEWLQTDSTLSGGQGMISIFPQPGPVFLDPETFGWLGWTSSTIGLFDKILDLQSKGVIQVDVLKGVADNKWLGRATNGIPLGLDILASIEDEGVSKAIWSEAIEFAIETSVEKALPVLIAGVPIVGQIALAYTVYDTALDVLGVAAGGLQVLGYEEQAIWLQNTVDTLDFGERFSEWLSDGAYDFLVENVVPDLDDATEAVVDIGSGFVKDAGELIGNTIFSL